MSDLDSPLARQRARIRRFVRWVFPLYLGAGLIILGSTSTSSSELFSIILRHPIAIVGAAVLIGTFVALSQSGDLYRLPTSTFEDVDKASRRASASLELRMDDVISEIQDLKSTDPAISKSIDELSKLVSALAASKPQDQTTQPLTFAAYYMELRSVIEEKVLNADTKASILLDRGVGFARFGIGFYLTAIITWQIVWAHFGFKPQYAYGLASTSLLFVFVEFLSAWFLKQYRQFVDTSTYLMKVKSIFDRYILTYLACTDEKLYPNGEHGSMSGILDILKEEIQWPESYLTKEPDTSFAKEFMTSIVDLTRSTIHSTEGKNERPSRNGIT